LLGEVEKIMDRPPEIPSNSVWGFLFAGTKEIPGRIRAIGGCHIYK
jgi:hypothetical protein